MKKTELFKVIRIDLKRAFVSYKFILSIILGVAVCYFTLAFGTHYKSETIHKFVLLHDRSQSFLAYIVGIISYALCFYDDFQYGNISNVIGRVKIRNYVFSKTVVAIFSTIAAFVLGKLCFVFVYSIDTPLCGPETLSRLPYDMIYSDLIRKGHYISYFFFTSFQKALLCAMLCQVVMLVSILIPNKAVVFCLPVAVFYVCNFYLSNFLKEDYLKFTRIFDGVTNLFYNDWLGLGYAVLIAFAVYFGLYRSTLLLVRKKVHDE